MNLTSPSPIQHLPMRVDPLLGSSLFALTDIISDPYPGYSVIPSRCRVTYDRRLLPGEDADTVLRAIVDQSDLTDITLNVTIARSEHQTYTGRTLREDKFFPAWILDEGHPLILSALRGLRAVGLSPKIGAYQFCTNGAYSAGIAKAPTIGFGPAQETDAHVANERVAVSDLITASLGYRSIVDSVLGM